jgi:hypothetical protein
VIGELMNVTADVVDRLDAPSLLSMLSPVGELDAARAGVLGLLLEEKAGALADLGDDGAARTREKAEQLLAAAGDAGFDREQVLRDAEAEARAT